MRPKITHLIWGLPLATVLAGLLVALSPADEPAPPTRAPPLARMQPHEPPSPPSAAAVLAVRRAPAVAAPLEGLSADERQALAAALAHHPSREAETRRVAGFLRLQRQVDAWRDGRADPALRQELGTRIEAALPAALAARSVSAGEALQLQAQLIADREPDAARARAELTAWQARHVAAAREPDASERAFLAQQQGLVAALGRQPDKLEPALEALRHKHFADPR
jgi:hypothetical protein